MVVAAGLIGYAAGRLSPRRSRCPRIPAVNQAAPPPDSVRILYSLDERQNDRQLVSLIDAAKTRVYFAIYEFTLRDVADALVRAKRRGVDVRGLVDARESVKPYDQPVIAELAAAGIPLETEHHPDGEGIMHIKAMVTDTAYALGSYNWTGAATRENDELLEIGTDPKLVASYAAILEKLLSAYQGAPVKKPAAPTVAGDFDFTQAPAHIGQFASVHGTLVDAHRTRSGTVFLDFCATYKGCPFSGVVLSSDAAAFGDLSRFAGQRVKLTGRISSYRGRAEIELSQPSQITLE